MLYDEFNTHKKFAGADVFKNKAIEKSDILKNLNPAFQLREYQKEALGRFYFYCEEYKNKQRPLHLMFNMATGSGKTLIMAASILYFYQKGYRNFIFFTRLGNLIQKTKANFLDPTSKKYLFADKIILQGREIKIKDVENFEGVNNEDINIIFTTIANLHSRFNSSKENTITYEDFGEKKVVLLGDEAHNFQAQTSKSKTNENSTWEQTILGNTDMYNTPGILNANPNIENVLLEFTATARLNDEAINKKYQDKAIYLYDLKEFRNDKFSKEVRTLQIDAPYLERALSAVVISQYRCKVAEKYKIALKPVIMFKANRVSIPKEGISKEPNPQIVVSSLFKEAFHKFISELNVKHLKQQTAIKNITLQKAFQFFKDQKITHEDLVEEIKSDFAPEKCLTVDEDKDLERKQILLNTLEDQNNEIRAIFATEKLNEGWDVLNLFDIVRLYNSRDASDNKPGKTTVQEAQLIGRGARYYPFNFGDFTDAYTRKFDFDIENELRILEQLYYHSVTNPRYIQELESALINEGIMPARTVQKNIKIKKEFKQTDFWENGNIFLNSRMENFGKDVFRLSDVKAEFDHNAETNIFQLSTREAIEKELLGVGVGDSAIGPSGSADIGSDSASSGDSAGVGNNVNNESKAKIEIFDYKITDLGTHIVRTVLAKLPSGSFKMLKKIFGNIQTAKDFIINENYLGGIKIKVKGTNEQIENLLQIEKLSIASFVIDKVLEIAGKENKEYFGSKVFKDHKIQKIFENDKVLQLDEDSPRAKEMIGFDFSSKDWFAQNEIWGTSEEEAFLRFIDETIKELKKNYQDIALIRNEQFFKIFNFEDGEPFYPDFVLLLKEKESKKEVSYQIFIEPKGDQFLDAQNTFEQSKEGWKQKLLIDIEKNYKIDSKINSKINFKFENKDFRMIGLPFFNEGKVNSELRKKFEQEFKIQLLN